MTSAAGCIKTQFMKSFTKLKQLQVLQHVSSRYFGAMQKKKPQHRTSVPRVDSKSGYNLKTRVLKPVILNRDL